MAAPHQARDTLSPAWLSRSEEPDIEDPSGAPSSYPEDSDDHDDSESDSESDSDRDASSEMDISPSPSPVLPAAPPAQPVGSKRKLPDATATANGVHMSNHEIAAKRQRLTSSPGQKQEYWRGTSSLPYQYFNKPREQTWQHICTYLPPAVLSRCLRVSKDFKKMLTLSQPEADARERARRAENGPRPNSLRTICPSLSGEAIWTNARRLFMHTLPKPLPGCTELQMLQLIGGQGCQKCGKLPAGLHASSPFDGGPGPFDVRVVWPLRIRACGSCIEEFTIKDTQLLLTSAASLRAGIAHTFLTQDRHYIMEIQRAKPDGIPNGLRVAKVYSKDDVAEIQSRHEDVKGYGEGTAEEWRKGLLTTGKEVMANVIRWENWETQMNQARPGLRLPQLLREYDPSSFTSFQTAVDNGTKATAKPKKKFGDIEKVRKARRADIEQRCLMMEPPLESAVLQHMESFQASLKIVLPLTDEAWWTLKGRLELEREGAEQIETRRRDQMVAMQAGVPSNGSYDTFMKPARDTYDNKYEKAQERLRKALGKYADDRTQAYWGGADGIGKIEKPEYATDVILHVAERYNQDKSAGKLEFPPYKADHGTIGERPFLSLDNMKWVYDNHIRPNMAGKKREWFKCADCEEEERQPSKWHAFEGLVQHYGAKHTTDFTRGNVVVHWQTAAWPGDPPFSVNPKKSSKSDRKKSEHKGASRSSKLSVSAPHPTAPGSAKLPMENPPLPQKNSSSFNQPASAASGHAQGRKQLPQRPSSTNQPQQIAPESTHPRELELASQCLRDVWYALEDVEDLTAPVRIYTALGHMIGRFEKELTRSPSQDLLTEVLATDRSLKELKTAGGLVCKCCMAEHGGSETGSYFIRIRELKLFNISSLLSHFSIVHQRANPKLDWRMDMIELPESSIVLGAIRTPGMNDRKLALIADALPDMFPSTLPTIGEIKKTNEDHSGRIRASKVLERMERPQHQPSKKKRRHNNGNAQDVSMTPPNEDEYDPRRPAYDLHRTAIEFDPSRMDTDLDPTRRTSTASSQPRYATGDVAPQIRAVMNDLSAMVTHQDLPPQPPPAEDHRERSPSVGGRESPWRSKPSQPSVQPDITSILASLGGLPTESNARPGSAHQSQHAASYGDPYPSSRSSQYDYGQRHAARTPAHTSAAYAPPQPAYQEGADPRHANAANYEHNRASTYPQHSHYYPPPQPHSPHRASYARPRYSPGPPRSPPRFQYVYADRPSVPPQPQPYHGQEAPVQYIPRPAYDYAPAPHQHHPHHAYGPRFAPDRPAPHTTYYDEYNRPIQVHFVPVDAAPAPVQYAPHPYEQAQTQHQPHQHQHPYPQYPPQPQYHPAPRYEPVRYEQAPPQPQGPPLARGGYEYGYAAPLPPSGYGFRAPEPEVKQEGGEEGQGGWEGRR